jgi:nitroreductase
VTLAERAHPILDPVRRFWADTRLEAERSRATSRKPAPGAASSWREALIDVLDVGYGVHPRFRWRDGAWERVLRRTTPSAGALYPFEALLALPGDGVHLWRTTAPGPEEPPRPGVPSRLVRLDTPEPPPASLAAAGLAGGDGEPPLRAVLLLAARPWWSTHKYHRRGYAYCHLDVGHAATNLALYASALGLPPAVHLRFDRPEVTAAFGLEGLCREPLAALVFRGPMEATEATAVRRLIDETGRLEPPGEGERRGWEELRGVLSVDAPVAMPQPPAAAPPLAEPAAGDGAGPTLPRPGAGPVTAREWRMAILGRRSAKGFLDRPLSLAGLGEVLAAARGAAVATDTGSDPADRLGLRVLARNVEGARGVFVYAPAGHALRRVSGTVGDPGPACMHQELARRAAAVLVLHAPIGRRIDERGWSAFAETHFRAAEVAQRMYLAAARLAPLGLTCIGGFDSDRCARLVALPEGEEVVYVVLLGVADEEAVKLDRLDVAYSHGHASTRTMGTRTVGNPGSEGP